MTLTHKTKMLSLSINCFPYYLWVEAAPVLCHPEKHVFNIAWVSGASLEGGCGVWVGRWRGWASGWAGGGRRAEKMFFLLDMFMQQKKNDINP